MRDVAVMTALILAIPDSYAQQTGAGQIPDSGRIQRESTPAPPLLPRPTPDLKLETDDPGANGAPGGPQVRVKRVDFIGNTLIDNAHLQAIIADSLAESLDLAGLRALAERISAAYRKAGYPFARAYLPPQELKDGVLQIAVLEGRYGRITATGDVELTGFAAGYLHDLKSGEPIASRALERRLLILADQPGLKISPLIRSGEEPGTGDLLVAVERTRLLNFDAAYDNHGSGFTGEHRLRLTLRVDAPFSAGHQLVVRGLSSNDDLRLGNVDYSIPVGVGGLRIAIGQARTTYRLGGDFALLDAAGTADVTSLTASAPVVRSPAANLAVSLAAQTKTLRDRLGIAESNEQRKSRVLGLSAQFDARYGGGLLFGSLGLTSGDLQLEGGVAAIDAATGRGADGGFSRWNADLGYLRPLGDSGVSLFAKLAAQRGDSNLDSSEKFGIGGPTGVRAYPIGEGNGDEGHLLQIEVRTQLGRSAPFLFFDTGQAKFNARPERLIIAPRVNDRSIAGYGAGVRLSTESWNLDAVAAWRSRGGAPQAEQDNSSVRFWLSVSHQFGRQ